VIAGRLYRPNNHMHIFLVKFSVGSRKLQGKNS